MRTIARGCLRQRKHRSRLEYGGDVGVALQHVGVPAGCSAHRDLRPRTLDRSSPAVPG